MSWLVDSTCRAANNADAKGQGIECLLRTAEGGAQLWSSLLEAARGAIAELGNLKCLAAYSTFAQPDAAIMKPTTEEDLLQLWQGAKRKQ